MFIDVYTLPVKFRSNQFIFNVLVSLQGHKRLFRPYLFELSSLSMNCQLFLSILPISIDVLSYGMTKGRFLLFE